MELHNSLCCISAIDTSILPIPTMVVTVFSFSVKKKKLNSNSMCNFSAYMSPLRIIQEIRQSSSYRTHCPPKYLNININTPAFYHSFFYLARCAICIFDAQLWNLYCGWESHDLFLKKGYFGPLASIFQTYTFKTVIQIWSSTSDLTTSNLGIEKSKLDLEHLMHLLFYLVPPTSSQFKTQWICLFYQNKSFPYDH